MRTVCFKSQSNEFNNNPIHKNNTTTTKTNTNTTNNTTRGRVFNYLKKNFFFTFFSVLKELRAQHKKIFFI